MNFQKIRSFSFSLLKSNWYLGLIFCVIFLLYLLGSYYENETDIFFVTYVKGLLTSKPLALPETYILQIIWGDINAYLCTLYPNFEWYDCLTFLFTFFIGVLLFKIYNLLKEPLQGFRFLRIVIQLFFTGIFVAATLIPEITRHSFLLITLVFVVILVKLFNREKVSSYFLFLCYVLFLFSSLRRPEPAIALTFLFVLYLLLLSFEGKIELGRATKIILPCLLLLSGVFIYTHIPRTPEGERYHKIVPYENTLVDFKGNLSDVHLKSKEDTIKYYAASHFFFTDTKHLNQKFFEKIGIVPLDKSPSYFFNYITRISIVKDRLDKLARDILENENGLFLLSIIINILWIFFTGECSLKLTSGRLLFSFAFWCTFLFANLFMKVETKVNESLLLFLIMIVLLYLIYSEITNRARQFILVLSAAIIICVGLKGFGFYQLYQIRKNDADYIEKVRLAVNGFSNSLVLFNISCWDNISIRLFDNEAYIPSNTYLSFDSGVLYIYDEYNNYMKRVTGRSEFIDQIDFVAREPKAYWFSSEIRMKMIIDYANAIYRKNYSYSLVKAIGRDKNKSYHTKAIDIYRITEK